MLKRLANIFIFLSVIITVGHNVVAHHHHFETEEEESHHQDGADDKHHDHEMFSFGQLDDSFIFSHSHTTFSNNVNTTLFLIPTNELSIAINFSIGRTDFITHQEFPPPEDYFHSTSLRGPPTI